MMLSNLLGRHRALNLNDPVAALGVQNFAALVFHDLDHVSLVLGLALRLGLLGFGLFKRDFMRLIGLRSLLLMILGRSRGIRDLAVDRMFVLLCGRRHLVLMFPLGVLQLGDSVENGYWHARSIQFFRDEYIEHFRNGGCPFDPAASTAWAPALATTGARCDRAASPSASATATSGGRWTVCTTGASTRLAARIAGASKA